MHWHSTSIEVNEITLLTSRVDHRSQITNFIVDVKCSLFDDIVSCLFCSHMSLNRPTKMREHAM